MQALQLEEPNKPPVYPIGPRLQTGPSGGAGEFDVSNGLMIRLVVRRCLFRLAAGARSPSTQWIIHGLRGEWAKIFMGCKTSKWKVYMGSYFRSQNNKELLGFLPGGFLDRTKRKGLKVPPWASQIEILAHGSTSRFLTPCGWSWVLDSIANGAPMIAWPLYARAKNKRGFFNWRHKRCIETKS